MGAAFPKHLNQETSKTARSISCYVIFCLGLKNNQGERDTGWILKLLLPLSLPAAEGAPPETPPGSSWAIPWKYQPRLCSQPGISEHCSNKKSPPLAAVFQQIPIPTTQIYTPRAWQAAFLPGVHEFQFPKCFMGLIGPFQQEKELPQPGRNDKMHLWVKALHQHLSGEMKQGWS